MAKNDRDRDREKTSAAPDPIREATQRREQETTRRTEQVVNRSENRVTYREPPTESRRDPVGYGNNRWGDDAPRSLVSESGGQGDSPSRNDKPPATPPKDEPSTPPSGRSKARGSSLSMDKRGRPEGQTRKDAPTPKVERREKREAPRKDARPEGQTVKDAPRQKREVVCKAPPKGKETRPKGGGGSGKRFVPYIGSKACK